MKREDRQQRSIERLKRQQEKANDRLDAQRQRVNQRFGRRLEKIGGLSDKQESIIEAALDILNEEGLENVTLRKLAQRLGVQAPAIYWHFKDKAALTDYMAEAILKKEFPALEPRQPDEPWQDWLIDTSRRLRSAMLAYRDGARVVAGAHMYPAVTLLKLTEVSMESLMSAGLELQRANLIVSTVIHFVFGRVIEEQSSPSLEELRNIDFNKFFQNYPYMAKSVQQTLDDAANGYDEFDGALRLIISYPEQAAAGTMET